MYVRFYRASEAPTTPNAGSNASSYTAYQPTRTPVTPSAGTTQISNPVVTPGSAGQVAPQQRVCAVTSPPPTDARMHELFADMYRQSDYQHQQQPADMYRQSDYVHQQQTGNPKANQSRANFHQPSNHPVPNSPHLSPHHTFSSEQTQERERRRLGSVDTPADRHVSTDTASSQGVCNGGITKINNEMIGPFYPSDNNSDATNDAMNDVIAQTKHDTSLNSSADSGFSPGIQFNSSSPTSSAAPASMTSSVSELSDMSCAHPLESHNRTSVVNNTSLDAFPPPPPPLNNAPPTPNNPHCTSLPTPPPALPTSQAPVWKPSTPASSDDAVKHEVI